MIWRECFVIDYEHMTWATFSGLLCTCNSEFSSIDCGGLAGDHNCLISLRTVFQPYDYLLPIGEKKIS